MEADLLSQIKAGDIPHTEPGDGQVSKTYITEDVVVQEPRETGESQLRKCVHLYRRLQEQDVPVPQVMQVHEEPFYVVFERIHGTALSEKDAFSQDAYRDAVTKAGVQLAKIHRVAAKGYGTPMSTEAFERAEYDTWDRFIAGYLENAIEYVQDPKFAEIAAKAAEHVVIDAIPPQPPSRILHMDYTPDNILVDDNRDVHVIDLGNAYYGDRRFDALYAELIFRKDGEAIRDAFWDGYLSVSDLDYDASQIKTYRALSVIQEAKAGEWCLRHDRPVDADTWRSGLQQVLDEHF